MSHLLRVHRFRDHAVAGVNWRPTRFVDEVQSSRVCGLCRMIPLRTVLLPCSHVLCQSCHAANSQARGGRCPLDEKPFEEVCVNCDLPPRTANALKVYCWNEAHGCRFEGAVEFMLRHYENECTFHTVECLRCGVQVLHRELSTHYVAGCSAAVSSACAENASSDSQAWTRQVEPLVDLPEEVLQAMCKTSSQDYPQHAITHIFPGIECHLELAEPLSTALTWREALQTVKYILTLANFQAYTTTSAVKFADITVLHTRDAYFTVEIFFDNSYPCDIYVGTSFHGMRGDSACPPPKFYMTGYNLKTGKSFLMHEIEKACDCEHDGDSWAHDRRKYYTELESLLSLDILQDGVKFEIQLCRE